MRTPFATIAVITLASLLSASPAGRTSSEPQRFHTIGARGNDKEFSSSPISARYPQAGVINTSPSDDGGNGTGDQIDDFTFKIPDTKTTLVVYLGEIVSRTNERNVINATINFLTQQLAASGDGQLPQNVDPFTYDLEQGVYVQVNSTDGNHLTWGILGATMSWLNLHLSGYAAYRRGVKFHVWDEPWGHVGSGGINRGYSGVPVPQVVAGEAGVAHY